METQEKMPNFGPVIRTLKTVENMGALDMNEGIVWDKGPTLLSAEMWIHIYTKIFKPPYHECGTVHCVAGWYVVAKLKADPYHKLHGEPYLDYGSGIKMANKDAGVELSSWASDHPGLWGNDYGLELWSHRDAWDDENIPGIGGPNDLTDVIQHLERVQKRINAKTGEQK